MAEALRAIVCRAASPEDSRRIDVQPLTPDRRRKAGRRLRQPRIALEAAAASTILVGCSGCRRRRQRRCDSVALPRWLQVLESLPTQLSSLPLAAAVSRSPASSPAALDAAELTGCDCARMAAPPPLSWPRWTAGPGWKPTSHQLMDCIGSSSDAQGSSEAAAAEAAAPRGAGGEDDG